MGQELPDLKQLLAELIATPSVSSVDPQHDQGNLAVIELLAGWLEELGFDCQVTNLPGQPHKANLIAALEPAAVDSARADNASDTGRGGLALCGHTDTVPCNPELWQSDPFTLSERDGRLYGLGTTDMKGFLALAVEAVKGLAAEQLTAPLVLLASADEESGMAGARALEQSWPTHIRPRQALIGEPTANLPVHMHKGMMMEALHIAGRSGHSSNPELGRNALEPMTRVLQELLDWREELRARYRDERFAVPYPTLNLGHIHGGDNPNRICGSAELHIDLRPLPGMAPEQLRAELRDRLQGALGDAATDLTIRSLSVGQPPLETPRSAPIIELAERLTGHPAKAVAFATEAPYLAELGMDVLVLGPGDIECAHQPDESLAVERLQPSIELLRGFIRHFCMEEAPNHAAG
ncbi:acetylornithine deacetylase [Halorhodospira halochloris]|uniref:Acetylornithine deacetylase n=1 Tax=Halorhodospira halochloris TaxID=1052 RepID=A0A110B2B9_HALHR|nr:acetylornithine deacetylase [Halorhodospira halochloris]MBK1651604.1 acetylornithine deacetylase [Halorhodospira halochloris]BAU58465.1 acetylornithine deacetylase [Halorhodospira halochloris]